ncbi:hypothetical protein YPPY90_1705, partial [Yersinia pestis PY-90]
MRADKDR